MLAAQSHGRRRRRRRLCRKHNGGITTLNDGSQKNGRPTALPLHLYTSINKS